MLAKSEASSGFGAIKFALPVLNASATFAIPVILPLKSYCMAYSCPPIVALAPPRPAAISGSPPSSPPTSCCTTLAGETGAGSAGGGVLVLSSPGTPFCCAT